MKINWKNVAAVLLVVGGGVGASVASIRSSAKTDYSAVASISESSMVSMKSEQSSCEMCSKDTDSRCTDSSCPQSESMTNMTTDKAMTMGGTMNTVMGGEKMSDISMANTMSQSMTEKSMAPSMGSSKMADGEQMAGVPKM